MCRPEERGLPAGQAYDLSSQINRVGGESPVKYAGTITAY